MTSHEVTAMLKIAYAKNCGTDLGLSPDLRATLERLLTATLEIERRERKPACECAQLNEPEV